MGTDAPVAAVLAALSAPDWAVVLDGVTQAGRWLGSAAPGDPAIDQVVSRLATLSRHSKWEVRRALAHVAAQTLHSAFEPTLSLLVRDENSRVRQAAEHAALRRRDWHNASTLGKQHEDHINALLDGIEARFGTKGRDAVKRVSEQMVNIFARELYHEVIKLVSPLATAAERLRTKLATQGVAEGVDLANDAERIGHRVEHLRSVLEGMRAYTAQPSLAFARESIRAALEEAAALASENQGTKPRPSIEIGSGDAIVEASRARLVQAFTNVLMNAVESYDHTGRLNPILVRVEPEDGRVVITIQDAGCGMDEEAVADATVLFSTSKPNGTGFGLPLAVKIIESEHGGRLSLESKEGSGTLVRVVLPTLRDRSGA